VSTDPAAAATASTLHADRILILDFGGQYTQLIARRVREAGVYCELHPYDMDVGALRDFAPRGVILSGGPASVTDDETPRVPSEVFDLGVPVLGICYGMQAMAEHFGGAVVNSSHHEYGYAQVRARGHSQLLRDIEDHTTPEGYGLLDVWMSHGDRVDVIPDGFKLIASTDNAPIAGIGDDQRGPAREGASWGASSTISAAAATCGRRATSSTTTSHGSMPRSAAMRCCSVSPAASIRRWWPRCCTARSAIN